MAEAVAATVGSWKFISLQTVAIAAWIYCNTTGIIHYDPYPFILLNLLLSLQAAYTAPMILMAANRQNEKDRSALYHDVELAEDAETRMTRMEKQINELPELVRQAIVNTLNELNSGSLG